MGEWNNPNRPDPAVLLWYTSALSSLIPVAALWRNLQAGGEKLELVKRNSIQNKNLRSNQGETKRPHRLLRRNKNDVIRIRKGKKHFRIIALAFRFYIKNTLFPATSFRTANSFEKISSRFSFRVRPWFCPILEFAHQPSDINKKVYSIFPAPTSLFFPIWKEKFLMKW